MQNVNILIAGVGGQGTLLASRILGAYASLSGFDCKLSEVHGMAQRGGGVVTHVIFGDRVYSPVIEDGKCDFLLAFEELEAARWAYSVKPDGKIIMNNQRIMPLPVITGAAEYPADIAERLKSSVGRLYTLDALTLARAAGSEKAVNTVMLGKLARVAGFDFSRLKSALELSVPQRFLQVNLSAIESGYGAGK
ncbi:MAG: indolepyruvate oxidoreductase subunit beta [Clostridiales bacterium]|jgi:indolepyruvate ferredoxin oxidoreductase beta subunit|nr:indolepyruvate oxidoreductase subunit beta [Clostridiales bacterium]